MAALRTGLRMLLPLRPAMVRRSLPLLLPSFSSPPRPLPRVAPIVFPPPLLQVRCMSGSLKTKGKPRGPLWRQRKGVSKEALQVVFELKRCKGEKLKERAVRCSSSPVNLIFLYPKFFVTLTF